MIIFLIYLALLNLNTPIYLSGFYKIKGKVAEDFGVFSLEVSWMEKCGYKNRSYIKG